MIRAARWRAARDGLDGQLVDLRAGTLVPAAELVRALLDKVREDLEELGDWDEVLGLTEALLVRGTSADRQRRVAAVSSGSPVGVLPAVVAAVADESASGLDLESS